MAPNAQIQNIPIESIERNQFETNYGEGRETIKRHFNNFEHYMQIRQTKCKKQKTPKALHKSKTTKTTSRQQFK